MSVKEFIQNKAQAQERREKNIHFSVTDDKLIIISPQHFEPKHLPFFKAILENEQANAQLIQPFKLGHLAYAHSYGPLMMDKHHHFEKVNDPLSFIKLNDLQDRFSFFQTSDTIIIVDRDRELWHTNATGRFETFQTGDVITLKDGQPATLLGLELEATYDNLQVLGMLSENVDTYHHDQNRADPAPVIEPIPEPVPVALPEALPARKFSVQKVIVNLCELYRNNETSVIEQADFKRRFDRQTDPLVKMDGFNAKHLYTDPAAVKSFLLNIPHADKVAMAANRNSLYSLLSNYHHKAQNAVEKFEYAYGPINEFCPAATEQVIAYLAFLDDKKMLGKDQLMKQGLERLEKASTMTNMNTDYTSDKFTMQDLKAHLVKSFEQIEDKKHERFKIRYKTQ
ncbi:hypothetical protein [Pseudomonas fluorescens]|uniref:hypothetical protein n=1 Tax=Pseudomonas fluorescens TaxID=294 RepID=UPI00058A6B6A|nr:hypothetical protein [Pseudomonas fluorescens]CEL31217.1 hypothetical protein SRM1_04581 [Pseudomonas fluorescens]